MHIIEQTSTRRRGAAEAWTCAVGSAALALVVVLIMVSAPPAASAHVAAWAEPALFQPAREAAAPWLTHYRELAATQPTDCAPTSIPALPPGVRTGAFVFARLAGLTFPEPGIVYTRDSIVERLLVLAEDARGCVHAGLSGRALPMGERTVASPLANTRVPAALGDTPPVAVVADAKAVREWIEYAPESRFRTLSARQWTQLGAYTGMLAVLLLVGLGFVAWQRNAFALAYVVYLLTLQFYQLQALGLGPAWIPFWPTHTRMMQALAVALVVPGITGVVLTFLRPRRGLTLTIAAGVALASAAFLSSAWTTWSYRLGAAVLAVLAVLVLSLLARRLRDADAALRWFAAGLGASMLGGGLQATSIAVDSVALPGVVSVAFPIGNLVESICWLIALTLKFRAEQAEDRRQLWWTAYHDPVTGLHNRHWLREELDRTLSKAERQPGIQRQVLLLDLDDFRQVNVCCGHAGGDAILRDVGAALQRVLEPGESIGRFGGDEFLVMLRAGQEPCAAEGRASSILAKLAEPMRCGARELRLKASIGIVTLNARYARVDDIIADAGLAQDAARQRGGNRAVRFEASMRSEQQAHERLRRELVRSLRAEQFLLHYQPVVALDTGRPLGCEALLRWQHPTRGLLPAAQFVPYAVAGGLIRELGYRVIHLACRQLCEWQQHQTWYQGEYLSINLSVSQLGDERLLAEVRRAMDKYGIDPSALRFEIPEAALTNDHPHISAWRERLLGQQLLVCLDGFGAGRTPVAPLADLSFDTIKLDRTLAAGVTHQGRAQALVQAGVSLGRHFSSLVVATGIQTREQLEAFKQLGCGYGQGDYLAPAMSAADVNAWVGLFQSERPMGSMSLSDSRLH
ncbi:MAG: EAL domain-containing protein [Thiohalocapsa sp.]|uniref:putative bifunctional diguanylate cyclase/phosphodiesterase n=1 Tax=Thiohalocapsa sp. TaxID=2497641 RepID=UPI0025E2E57D|nr:EAL domain-containing protein [Thiohalocapsa sp.]MCG6940396.1 EAL domain-containing protein [Thiohalocapsa sp.]